MTGETKHAASAALIGYFGLLGLWVAWATVFAQPRHVPTSLVLVTSTLPLLPWLRGLLYDRRGAYLWLGLFSLLYFIHGIGALLDRVERYPAILEVFFSVILFGGCLMRLKQKPRA